MPFKFTNILNARSENKPTKGRQLTNVKNVSRTQKCVPWTLQVLAAVLSEPESKPSVMQRKTKATAKCQHWVSNIFSWLFCLTHSNAVSQSAGRRTCDGCSFCSTFRPQSTQPALLTLPWRFVLERCFCTDSYGLGSHLCSFYDFVAAAFMLTYQCVYVCVWGNSYVCRLC